MTEARLRAIPDMTELEHRFWSKVEIVDDDDSCWPWKRATSPDGYGLFQWAPPGEEKNRAVNAQRVALYLVTGIVPVIGCHDCDNPPCCRPKHLYDGDHVTNGADKATRGRARGKTNQRGEANDSAVLTNEIVIEARIRSKAGETQRSIAADFGFEQATLAYAIQGKTWSHLDAIEAPHVRRRGGGTRLDDDDIRTIRKRAATGDKHADIAADYGMDRANISHIVNRKTFKHVTD